MREQIIDINKIQPCKCPSDEQETTIQFDRNGDSLQIWTNDSTVLTKLKKLMQINPIDWKCYVAQKQSDGSYTGYFFESKKSNISFKAKKKTRILSDEQKQAIAERFKKGREK